MYEAWLAVNKYQVTFWEVGFAHLFKKEDDSVKKAGG